MRNSALRRLKIVEKKLFPTQKVNLIVIKSIKGACELTVNGESFGIPNGESEDDFVQELLNRKRINVNSTTTMTIKFTEISDKYF